MTSVAGHIGVASRQGQGGACVVVESRRRPAFRVVAVFAKCFAVFRELLAMHIGVTTLAIRSGALEIYKLSANWNEMACSARGRTVSPE